MAPLSADAVYDHLIALRSSLFENKWMGSVDAQVLVIFNELLTAAQKLAANDEVLRAIEHPKATVRPQPC